VEAIERGTQSPRVEHAIDGNSERILRRMAAAPAPAVQPPPPVQPAESPPKKLPAGVGERRLRIELAQELACELIASVRRDEMESERHRECTFSPKHEAKPPKKRSPPEHRPPPKGEDDAPPDTAIQLGKLPPIIASIGKMVEPFTQMAWKRRSRSVQGASKKTKG
jgi:hypothetical protein